MTAIVTIGPDQNRRLGIGRLRETRQLHKRRLLLPYGLGKLAKVSGVLYPCQASIVTYWLVRGVATAATAAEQAAIENLSGGIANQELGNRS